MPKVALWALIGSIALLFPIFVFFVKSFQPLYYVLWVVGVGGYVYRNHVALEQRFQSWNIGPFKKFLLLGIGAILTEEIFASTSMHLMRYVTTGNFSTYFYDILQFWALNLLTLPGLIIGWYFLLRRYAYTKKEIFILAGLFGLYAEKIYQHIILYPTIAWLLIVPTVFTYGVIVSIPALSIDHTKGKESHGIIRYALAFIIPFICIMPFIAIALYIKANHPELFPPAGFFM
ncbi:MAG: hypothetical protein QG653_634 [Patescibacteria group bacterium]|nr:hypothetical protein [Patescibacteria group bacterium]